MVPSDTVNERALIFARVEVVRLGPAETMHLGGERSLADHLEQGQVLIDREDEDSFDVPHQRDRQNKVCHPHTRRLLVRSYPRRLRDER